MQPSATRPDAVTGLSSEQVAERVLRGEVNKLPPRSGRSSWDIVKANVFTRINAMLLVLFGIVISTGSWINAAFGLLIIANSGIGIIQELRAKRTLDSLTVIGEAHPTVIREGQQLKIHRDQIVLDDIIYIQPGDQVVVDGLVVSSEYLELDESLLNGEADPVVKNLDDPVLSGSFVISGTGCYQATKVGSQSYAAQLTAQAAKFSLTHSELQAGVNSILKLITYLLFPVGLLTIWVQLSRPDVPWQKAVLAMAGALVPMVPEGLVLLTSIAFALGVIRLGRRKCLVQEMPAIEMLARVDVVCADKTGTLTENKMVLSEIVALGDQSETELTELLSQLAAADPAPNASLQAIVTKVGKPSTLWPVLVRVPFTSAKKWSAVSFTNHGNWILGAPDVLSSGEVVTQAQKIASSGRRVLLCGQTPHPVDSSSATQEVTPVALIVLNQLIRTDAKDTLKYFAGEQVALKVISGDNALSVGAVTSTLGLSTGKPIDARDLPQDPAQFEAAVNENTVFGRVTPEQKRRMVSALQANGHTVAMTGDGVNDVLALKDADLGVAMGSGAPATRAVAQIVLLNDKFSSLPQVVNEGRRVLGNIERVAKLFLTKTVYSVILALLTGTFGMLFPFQPIHITITGWFTIGIPAFLLSLAPTSERARPGFVARVLTLSIPAGIIVGLITFMTYWLVQAPFGASSTQFTQANTATLSAMILSSTWVLAIVTRPYRWWKIGLIVSSLLVYLLIFTLPWTQQLFVLDSSDWSRMSIGLVCGLVGIGLIEILWWVTVKLKGESAKLW